MPLSEEASAPVFSEDEERMLERLRKSRTEQKRRTVRAAILLDSVAGLNDQAIARDHGVNHNTVILCIQKCLRFGVQAALGELPRSGKPRRVSDAAIAWVQNSACQKPKELGYAQELWTYGLLTAHLRREARSAGYPEMEQVCRSKLHKILMQGELRPHKVRYYVERRDPEFESKMAVLHVYKEVEILNEGLLRGEIRELGMVTVSYDEKSVIACRVQFSGLATGLLVANYFTRLLQNCDN
jgi:transposase